jgi:hypothetical protein
MVFAGKLGRNFSFRSSCCAVSITRDDLLVTKALSIPRNDITPTCIIFHDHNSTGWPPAAAAAAGCLFSATRRASSAETVKTILYIYNTLDPSSSRNGRLSCGWPGSRVVFCFVRHQRINAVLGPTPIKYLALPGLNRGQVRHKSQSPQLRYRFEASHMHSHSPTRSTRKSCRDRLFHHSSSGAYNVDCRRAIREAISRPMYIQYSTAVLVHDACCISM